MASAKDIDDFINSLKAKLFQFVELFCTNLQKKSEEEVCSDLILMEVSLGLALPLKLSPQGWDQPGYWVWTSVFLLTLLDPWEAQWGQQSSAASHVGSLHIFFPQSICSADMADAVDAQVNNSESCPLLRETLQELRRRVCEPSGSYSPPGRNQPFDSSTSRDWYDWILELFKELLRRLQQKFQKALEWLHQIAAACLQGLRIAAEAVWRVLNDFCSSLEQLFRSLIQV
nr:PREDICTED: uncharacterized protein LOC109578868 isoform X1 [Bos indicus]XP_019843944.1 PREDICTED: uncharacterized protein LOC109578868 isoform X1 [Bos indicus]